MRLPNTLFLTDGIRSTAVTVTGIYLYCFYASAISIANVVLDGCFSLSIPCGLKTFVEIFSSVARMHIVWNK